MTVTGIVDGIIANGIFTILIPFILWALGALWWFKKKYQYGIVVPAKELDGRFDNASFLTFTFARAYLTKTESGTSVEFHFSYFGIKSGSKYFFYWKGDRGNGFSIIQKSSQEKFKYEGKNLFFEKKADVTQMTTQDFFLYQI